MARRKLIDPPELDLLLATLPGWQCKDRFITKLFRFDSHHEVMAFVNAIAWISHREDHHPDMQVGYNQCLVSYTTHDSGGLTGRDFACAAKVEALLSS